MINVDIRMPRPVRGLVAVAGMLVAGYALHSLGLLGGHAYDPLFQKWVNTAIPALCTAVVLVRAVRVRRERLAWSLLGVGLICAVAGNVYYALYVIEIVPLPIPSVADAIWLSEYPLTYTALILLLFSRVRNVTLSMSLDGVIAATATASISAAVVLSQVMGRLDHSSPARIATSLAYPVGDLILIGLVLVAVALNHWRLVRTWVLLAAAFCCFAVTDGFFLYKTADGTYTVGTIIDAGWHLTAFLAALAAWQPVVAAAKRSEARPLSLVAPAFFGLISLAVLVWDHFHRVGTVALVLSAVSVFAVIVRMALAFIENVRRAEREEVRLVAQNAERARLLARTVEVAEEERSRIAAELHDGPIQKLTVMAFNLDRLALRLARNEPGAEQMVHAIRENLGSEMGALRRVMSELRPPILDERDLEAALNDCAELIFAGVEIAHETTCDLGAESPAPEIETAVYRVVREALTNVMKHAGASRVVVDVNRDGGTLRLVIADNGNGFEDRPPAAGHFGLLGMRERIGSVGGTVDVVSAIGSGTRVEATLPWRARLVPVV